MKNTHNPKFNYISDRLIKAVKLPWMMILWALSMVIPKKRDLWVVGRRTGVGDGPLALYLELIKRNENIQFIWLTSTDIDDELAAKFGIRYVRKDSLLALWLCLRASVAVVCMGFSDLRGPAIWGSYVVQLWHGSPLKRIGFDRAISGFNLPSKIVMRMAMMFERYWNSHYDLIVAASDLTASRFSNSFGLSSQKIAVLGDPRCDLVSTLHNYGLKLICAATNLNSVEIKRKKIILYAPTWREIGHTRIFPSEEELSGISETLNNINALMLFRFHPFTGFADHMRHGNIFFFPSNDYPDILPTFESVDLLITDYSSIAMDFSLLEKPIVFFAQDEDEYEFNRGLYEAYESFTAGTNRKTWEDAMTYISSIFSNDECYDKNVAELARPIRERYQNFNDRRNSSRVIEYIKKNTS